MSDDFIAHWGQKNLSGAESPYVSRLYSIKWRMILDDDRNLHVSTGTLETASSVGIHCQDCQKEDVRKTQTRTLNKL